jgi:hypothetical protein
MKFTANVEEDRRDFGMLASLSSDRGMPISRPSSLEHFQKARSSSIIDIALTIERVKQGLDERQQKLQKFLRASTALSVSDSPDKLAYQRELDHIISEVEIQAKNRNTYMESIENLMNERSTVARAQLQDFIQKQKEIEELQRKRAAAEQLQQQEEQEKRRLQEEQEKRRLQEEQEKRRLQEKQERQRQDELLALKEKETVKEEQSLLQGDSNRLEREQPIKGTEIYHNEHKDSLVEQKRSLNAVMDIYTSQEVSERVLYYAKILKVYSTIMDKTSLSH